jgi:hypothetical protein
VSWKHKIPIDVLSKLLSYNPETGDIVWLETRSHAVPGAVAGWVKKNGRREISVCGKTVQASRVAWALYHKEWPDAQVDHINLNPLDNRISNLRLATQAENHWNVGPRKTNKTGLKGVCKIRGVYIAQIQKNKRKTYLGSFKSAEEAHRAYRKAAASLHNEFARTTHE